MQFILYYIIPFVAVLGILIFVHELGHFLVAKWCNVKVLKFSLGLGPKVIGKTFGETEYCISIIPFGGYVKLLGQDSSDEEDDVNDEKEEKKLHPSEDRTRDRTRAFSEQSIFKRMAIIASGSAFNLIFAIAIFCGYLILFGNMELYPEIGKIREGSPAEKAGLLTGDVISDINKIPVKIWPDIKASIEKSPRKELSVAVKRNNQLLVFTMIPEESSVKNLFGEEVKSFLIGIEPSGNYIHIDFSLWEGIKMGFDRSIEMTKLTILTIFKLFQGVVSIKTLGGPIMIGQISGEVAKSSILYLLPFMAVISINLAVLNLLPIPVLDGGYILLLFIELIFGKSISEKGLRISNKIGFYLLLLLMAIVVYNDILRLFE